MRSPQLRVLPSLLVLAACGGSASPSGPQDGTGSGVDAGSGPNADSGSNAATGADASSDSGPTVVGSGGLPGQDAGPASTAILPEGGPDGGQDSPSSPPASFGLNQTCDGVAGLTGQALLDTLKPQYLATLTHSSGKSTQLTITPTYAGGQVTCHPAFHSNGGAPDLPAYFDVVVQLDFVTADGVFRERFPTAVNNSIMNFGGSLGFYAVVPTADLKGTFKPDLPGGTLSVDLIGYFKGATTNGSVVQRSPPCPPNSTCVGGAGSGAQWQ